MAGLYIHIPFCHHKCIYCDFYSIAQKFNHERYVDALIHEMQARKGFLTQSLSSIYLGGGTPSLLNLDLLSRLFHAIDQNFTIEDKAEITFEANPENINQHYISEVKSMGVNRISLGVQSFDDRDLKLLNRSHNSAMVHQAIMDIKSAKISNLSIDLISNLPGTTLESWQENLEKFLDYDLQHISCYTLMREEGTMLDTLLNNHKISLLSEEEQLQQLDLTMDTLQAKGYSHYETSSYALNNYESKHNLAYWTFQPYLGLGAGAHSFSSPYRCWNEDNVSNYCERIENQNFSFEDRQETLTPYHQYNEYVMLASRMQNGLNPSYIQEKFPQYYDYFSNQIKKAQTQFLLDENLALTRKGWHLQDELILLLAL